MTIYTHQGDDGKTSLRSGEKTDKTAPIVELLGGLDESNTAIGLALALLPEKDPFRPYHDQLTSIQRTLLTLGAQVAQRKADDQAETAAKELERWIDQMDGQLPPLDHFILPGGAGAGAALHVARATTRRTERACWRCVGSGDPFRPIGLYLNRLADYLFVVARMTNALAGVSDVKR